LTKTLFFDIFAPPVVCSFFPRSFEIFMPSLCAIHSKLTDPTTPISEIRNLVVNAVPRNAARIFAHVLRMDAGKPGVCTLFEAMVNVSGHGRKHYRRAAAEKLLASPLSTQDELARVVQNCDDDLKYRAAGRILASGEEIRPFARRMISLYCPDLLGEKDNSDKRLERSVISILRG
jgi:hypothetical protein